MAFCFVADYLFRANFRVFVYFVEKRLIIFLRGVIFCRTVSPIEWGRLTCSMGGLFVPVFF